MILIVGHNSKLAKYYIENYKKSMNMILSSRSDNSKYKIDLEDYKNIIFLPKNITKAIIFAGISNIKYCENNQSIVKKVNIDSTIRLINDLNERGIKCLFVSSGCVYSEMTLFNSENDIRNPSNFYGMAKKLVEDEIIKSDLNSIVRLTKVIDSKTDLINNWINKLANNENIMAYNNVKISPISFDFTSKFFYDWSNLDNLDRIIHLTNTNELTYYDFAKQLANKLNFSQNLIIPSQADLSKTFQYSPLKANLSFSLRGSRSQSIEDFWQDFN